jgi:hypothetical protein
MNESYHVSNQINSWKKVSTTVKINDYDFIITIIENENLFCS